MNIPYVFKKCSKCGEILPATTEYFYKNKGGKYGFKSICKECDKKCHKEYCKTNKEAIKEYQKEYNKKYYEANKETIAERKKVYGKKYYKQNKEAIAEYAKKYRQDNKETIAKQKRQYYEQNKEHKAEYGRQYCQSPRGQVVIFNRNQRRRAKEQAQGRGITKEQWLECMSFFNWQCAYSGITLSKETRSIDHIEPISKGGANEIWNLVPMYKNYNLSKHDKDLLEWYTEQPYFSQDRLDKIYEWQEYAYNKWGIDTEAQ